MPTGHATSDAAVNHVPEQLAAAYLTTMRPRRRRRFEAHLLTCETCWQEVRLARRGRQLAETARDLAPPRLREDIRAAVTAAAASPAPRARPVRPIVAAAVTAVTAVAALAAAVILPRLWSGRQPPDEAAPPAAIAAAVTSYRSGQLPGTAVPAEHAPVLTPLNLKLTGTARSQLHGITVTMFSYSAPSGARLLVIRSSHPFPEASGARELDGTQDAWMARSSGVTIICAQDTHAMLLLGSDPALVRQAGALLGAI